MGGTTLQSNTQSDVKLMKTVSRFIIMVLILILGTTGLIFYWTFYKPLPDYEGTITLETLKNPVDIHWDKDGVPHIYATNKHDLYLSLGYVHARDRLWQMTLSQLLAEGRMAEFLGEDLISFDKQQRILGIWEVARKIEQDLTDSTRFILEAYTKGVNTFLQTNKKKLPIEFSLTGIEPIPWTTTHSIALTRLMAWNLNVSWWPEIMYGYLKDKLTEERFQQLTSVFDSYPVTADSKSDAKYSSKTYSDLLGFLDLELQRRRLLQNNGSHTGSNAWVVDGKKTASGFPLLAGDPHLGLQMPGTWYEAHVSLDGFNLSGATLAGAPVFVLGQNNHLGWSLTNIMADDTDFFVEKVNPTDRGQYIVDSLKGEAVTEPFEISRQIINIKGGGEELLEIRKTKHGPVISDIYPNDSLIRNRVISLQWSGHNVSQEIEALLGINWAASFSEFKEHVPKFRVPGQHFIYGDVVGNIGIFSAASIPIRSYNPILPRKGWDPSYDWHGFIPYDKLPKTINPARNYVANANNKVNSAAQNLYLATFWEPESRIQRITQILENSDSLRVEDFALMQNDTFSHHAKMVVETILPILRRKNNNGRFNVAISYLENWNYLYEPNATAASILDVFFVKFTKNTLLDEVGEEAYQNFVHIENIPVRTMNHLLKNSSQNLLFDDLQTNNVVETRTDMITKSMEEALDYLSDTYGSETFEWRWEQLHSVHITPPLLGRAAREPDASGTLKLIVKNILSVGPEPAPGHSQSINSTQYQWTEPYEVTNGPSIRRIVDFSDLSKTYSITPTGQSGRPLSEHFGDQFEMWLNGEYKYLYQDSTLFRRAYLQSLHLTPK